jgi:hypothetical protein
LSADSASRMQEGDQNSALNEAGFDVTVHLRTDLVTADQSDPTYATLLQLREAGGDFADCPFVVAVGTLCGNTYFGVGVDHDAARAQHGAYLALLAHSRGAEQPIVGVENIVEHCRQNHNVWIAHPGCKASVRRLQRQQATRFGPRFKAPEIIEYVPDDPASPVASPMTPPGSAVSLPGAGALATSPPAPWVQMHTGAAHIGRPTYKQANTPLFNRVWDDERLILREVCRQWNHDRCAPRASLCINRCPEGLQRAHVCNYCASPEHTQERCTFTADTLHLRFRQPTEEESASERELQQQYARERSASRRRPRSASARSDSAPPPPPLPPPGHVGPYSQATARRGSRGALPKMGAYPTQQRGGSSGSGTVPAKAPPPMGPGQTGPPPQPSPYPRERYDPDTGSRQVYMD